MTSSPDRAETEACLTGVRVVEFGSGIGLGFCGRLLALLGAGVVKLVSQRGEAETASLFERAQRVYLDGGKRVEELTAEGTEWVERCRGADVVIYGIERSTGASSVASARAVYERVREVCPRVVFAALTPFGVDGPSAGLAGGELNAQALSGWTSIVGNPDEAPLSMGYGVAAMQHGLGAAGAIAAALLTSGGDGEFIDISEAEVIAALIRMYQDVYRFAGIRLARAGHRAPGSSGRYPHTTLPCKDGTIVVICRAEVEWDRMLAMMGNPEWGSDPRYRDFHAMATEYPDQIDELIIPWFKQHTKAELTALTRQYRVPLAPIRTAEEVLEDPQLAYRRFFGERDFPGGRPVRLPLLPAIWTRAVSDQPKELRGPSTTPALREESGVSSTVATRVAGGTRDKRFEDLLVVETGTGLAGPMATRVLRDLGARVIKVESRTRLDGARNRVPRPDMTPEEKANITEIHPQIHEMNAGKESITLNLKTSEGRSLFLSLLARADVYVDNFAPGWLERIGLSLAQIQALNPRIIVVSESAYGSEGPLSDLRAYAPVMTALSGVESIVGYEDGRVVPQISSAVGDLVAAFFGALLALSGLYERVRTGTGAIIDMSQIEASTTMGGIMFAEYGLTNDVPVPRGNWHPEFSPHGIYPTSGPDKWVALAVWSDDEWRELCSALAISDTMRARFATTERRLAERDLVDELVSTATSGEGRDSLCERLQALGISCTPVLDCYEAEYFPGFRARDNWVPITHPVAGDLRLTRVPWHFDHIGLGPTRPADWLGGSTKNVLEEIADLDAETFERYAAASVFE